MTTYTKDQVDAKIVEFVAELQRFVTKVYADSFDEKFNETFIQEIVFENGSKNAKIIKQERVNGDVHNRSVHCFIDRNNGNILKAAGWKAPAPNGVRGNIFTSENMGVGSVDTQYGCIYLRG